MKHFCAALPFSSRITACTVCYELFSAHCRIFSNALSSPCCLYWYWCKGSSSCGIGCGSLLLPSIEEMTCCKSWDLPIIASGYFHYTVSFYVWFILSTSSKSLTSLQAIFLSLCFYTELSFLMFFAFPNSVNKGSKTTLFAHRGISQRHRVSLWIWDGM